MNLVDARNLHVTFGDTVVLEDVSLEIAKGDVLAIVGPNGAGKSVLVKTLLGLIKPTSGEIIRAPELKTGYAPQRLDFDKDFPLTVEEFMLMQSGARILFPGPAAKDNVDALLDEVGAALLAQKKMGALSGGQLQRVVLASTLAGDPDIVYLDEPSAGLDIGGEKTIYHLLDELHKARALTFVIVSHDTDFVYHEASKVLCLNQRRLCYGVPEEAMTADVLNRVFREMVTPYQHEHGE